LHRTISFEEANTLAQSWGLPYFETSAKTRVGVKEAFSALVRLSRTGAGNSRISIKHLEARKRCSRLMKALSRREYNVGHYRSWCTGSVLAGGVLTDCD